MPSHLFVLGLRTQLFPSVDSYLLGADLQVLDTYLISAITLKFASIIKHLSDKCQTVINCLIFAWPLLGYACQMHCFAWQETAKHLSSKHQPPARQYQAFSNPFGEMVTGKM